MITSSASAGKCRANSAMVLAQFSPEEESLQSVGAFWLPTVQVTARLADWDE